MSVYKCKICGFIFDEAKEGRKLSELDACPVCKQPLSSFEKIGDSKEENAPAAVFEGDLAYDARFVRQDDSARYMAEIHQMATTGKSLSGAMGTLMPVPGWDELLLLGAQLDPAPLLDDEPVDARTVIGKHAKQPMVLESPVYISHMSFGALSREAKIALSKGSALAKTAMCSGEGGILPEERAAAYKYIFEYIPNKYSATDENLRAADAIEIKIGQGTKPGMGGHLPGGKVTPEIAALRGKKPGEDVQSPSKFPEINSKEDLKAMVDELRARSGGRPIGIKIAAGHIEADLAHCVYAAPDFITIDGRGGATGSSPLLLREATTVPTMFALTRARKYLDAAGADISADCRCLPAVPYLRHGELPGGHRDAGSGAARASRCGRRRAAGGEFPERVAGRAENLCPDYGPRLGPRPRPRRPRRAAPGNRRRRGRPLRRGCAHRRVSENCTYKYADKKGSRCADTHNASLFCLQFFFSIPPRRTHGSCLPLSRGTALGRGAGKTPSRRLSPGTARRRCCR